MNLEISNRESFLANFLTPIGKVTENAVIKVEPKKISTLVTSNDGTIITYSEYKDESIDQTYTLNIPDIKKFTKLVNCIEEEKINLEIDINCLKYKSNSVRFKYHLYDDGIIPVPSLNLDKLNKIQFDGKFTTTNVKMSALLKGSIFVDSNEKVYISTNGNIVEADITDRSKHNTNSFATNISENYEGVQFPNALPFKFDIVQHITQYKTDIYNVEVATKHGILTLTLQNDNSMTKFIISALKN